MQTTYLEKLEFNKIKNTLSSYAQTNNGKKMCLDLYPSSNKEKVQKALDETTEAVALIYRKGNLPLETIGDISTYILNLKNQNFLSSKALLELATLLKTSKILKNYYFEKELNQTDSLTNYFDHLYTNPSIEEKIFSAIIDENTFDDRASNALYKIRQQMRNTKKEIKNKLQSLLNSKYLQEPIVTIRQDRFVVPVKSEYQTEIKGFIHDTSSTGSTVFVEPISVFDLNNQLSELKNQENIEIEKILQILSSLFFDITNELENNFNLITILDFIFAKAKYSKELDCNCPKINNDKLIYLKNAKHPLLDQNIAVPITLEIGKTF